jgi:hypothetical protein
MLSRVAFIRTDVSEKLLLRSVLRLLVTVNVVPSSPILFGLMMDAISSYEESVLTKATWRNIPEEGVLLPDYTSTYQKRLIIY